MFKSKKDKLDKEIMKNNLSELEDFNKENKNISPEADKEKNAEEFEKEEQTQNSTGGIDENKLQAQIDLLKDQLYRKAADFENYKKRTESELSTFFKYANEALIVEILPVLDDFDRLFNSFNEKQANNEQDGIAIATSKKGIELIYEKLMKILKKYGLKEMETDGKKFDFHLHDALLQVSDDKYEPNTILSTAERGYYLKDKVIRHAKVIVSSGTTISQEEKNNNKGKNENKAE